MAPHLRPRWDALPLAWREGASFAVERQATACPQGAPPRRSLQPTHRSAACRGESRDPATQDRADICDGRPPEGRAR